MTLSDNSKKRLAQGAAVVGTGAGVTGFAMLPFTIQACSMPFNAGHAVEELKDIWSPGNTIGDVNISAVILFISGWVIFILAMQYLESNEKNNAGEEVVAAEIPQLTPERCSVN
jgi:hypothetical protein